MCFNISNIFGVLPLLSLTKVKHAEQEYFKMYIFELLIWMKYIMTTIRATLPVLAWLATETFLIFYNFSFIFAVITTSPVKLEGKKKLY